MREEGKVTTFTVRLTGSNKHSDFTSCDEVSSCEHTDEHVFTVHEGDAVTLLLSYTVSQTLASTGRRVYWC